MSPDWIGVGSAVGGIAGLGVVLRVARRPVRAVRVGIHKLRRIAAVLIGEDPIRDPDTGVELRPAQPDIVSRLQSMQDDAKVTREIVERLADVHDEVARVQAAAEHAQAAAERAQQTGDKAIELAKKALDRIDVYHPPAADGIPQQRISEGA